MKPIVARVRVQRLTTFYPLAPGQPHPACALRRSCVRKHAPSRDRLHGNPVRTRAFHLKPVPAAYRLAKLTSFLLDLRA